MTQIAGPKLVMKSRQSSSRVVNGDWLKRQMLGKAPRPDGRRASAPARIEPLARRPARE